MSIRTRNEIKAEALDEYAAKWAKMYKFSGTRVDVLSLIKDLKESAEKLRKCSN